MARALTANMITEITAQVMRPAFLVKMEFDSGDENLWTGLGTLSFGGDTYTGAGQMLSFSAMRETAADVATGATIVLAGELSSLISIALSEKYMGRPISIWLAAFDTSDALIADPELVFKGRMDTMQIASNGKQTKITMNAESDLIRLETPNARRLNDAEQQRDFPGDLGFEFAATLANRQIPWGVESDTPQTFTGLFRTAAQSQSTATAPPPQTIHALDDAGDDDE